MTTLTDALLSAQQRRDRFMVALNNHDGDLAHTLNILAECAGRVEALSTLLAFPAERRRDHATRRLAEMAQRRTPEGAARTMAAAEAEVYAMAISGDYTLT